MRRVEEEYEADEEADTDDDAISLPFACLVGRRH
jgi:hypothetical protein